MKKPGIFLKVAACLWVATAITGLWTNGTLAKYIANVNTVAAGRVARYNPLWTPRLGAIQADFPYMTLTTGDSGEVQGTGAVGGLASLSTGYVVHPGYGSGTTAVVANWTGWKRIYWYCVNNSEVSINASIAPQIDTHPNPGGTGTGRVGEYWGGNGSYNPARGNFTADTLRGAAGFNTAALDWNRTGRATPGGNTTSTVTTPRWLNPVGNNTVDNSNGGGSQTFFYISFRPHVTAPSRPSGDVYPSATAINCNSAPLRFGQTAGNASATATAASQVVVSNMRNTWWHTTRVNATGYNVQIN